MAITLKKNVECLVEFFSDSSCDHFLAYTLYHHILGVDPSLQENITFGFINNEFIKDKSVGKKLDSIIKKFIQNFEKIRPILEKKNFDLNDEHSFYLTTKEHLEILHQKKILNNEMPLAQSKNKIKI